MPSLATILTSLEGADRAIRFELVGKLGRIRSRRGGREFFLDFRPYGRVWSNRGIRITDEATAHRLLEQIRGKVAEDRPLEEVLAGYLPAQAKPNLVPVWIEKWLDVKRRETAAGDRSPTYLRELERYGRRGGHFSWWQNRSIHEIEFGTLEDWSHWLADRGLSPKTRHNVIAAFRSFVGWLKRRRQLRELPEFPWPKVPEHDPRVLTLETQDAILDAIPEADRGIFLVLARMGLRPGEAVALQAADYQDGWLHVTRALKGRRLSDPIRAPKNNRGKRLPVDPELQVWIEKHVRRSGESGAVFSSRIPRERTSRAAGRRRRCTGDGRPRAAPWASRSRSRSTRAPSTPSPPTRSGGASRTACCSASSATAIGAPWSATRGSRTRRSWRCYGPCVRHRRATVCRQLVAKGVGGLLST